MSAEWERRVDVTTHLSAMARTPLASKHVRVPKKDIKRKLKLAETKRKFSTSKPSKPVETEAEKAHRRRSPNIIRTQIKNLCEEDKLELVSRTAMDDVIRHYMAELDPTMRISKLGAAAITAYVCTKATLEAQKMAKTLGFAGKCTLKTDLVDSLVE